MTLKFMDRRICVSKADFGEVFLLDWEIASKSFCNFIKNRMSRSTCAAARNISCGTLFTLHDDSHLQCVISN